jgi:tetratricopeptide (TPR) repeat protein
MKQLVTVGLFLSLLSSISLCQEDPFASERIQEIQRLHDEAVGGGKEQTEVIFNILEKLTRDEPQNALALAYLGSVYTLKSRDAFPGPSKFSFLKKGLKTMDQAVKMDPQNPAPRFIRAMNNFHLPAIINRRDNARADFEVLLKQIEDPHTSYRLRVQTREVIYYFAGLSFQQLGREKEARAAWEKGRALNTSTPFTEKITAALAKFNG